MPDVIAPPTPSAPSTPAAPAAPAAPSAPVIPSGAREPAGSDAFGDIDALGTDDGKPEPAQRPEAKEGNKDFVRGPDGKFAPRTPVQEPEKPKAELDKPELPKPELEKATTPPAEVPSEKMAPKQLREAYEALKAKHKALETEHTTLKTKASTPAEDPEKKTLAERLAAREKRLQEVEDELRFTDYSKSEEYKEKYEKPFVEAYMNGRARIASMKLAAKTNEETGEIIPGREATAADFDALMKISDDDVAADWAVEHFGSKASLVLIQRERVQELNQARNKALEEFRKIGSEREKTRATELETFRKRFGEIVDTNIKSAAEKYPQWFQPDPADAKGNEMLEKGQHLVARVVANGAPVKEGDKPMTPEEYASAVAAVRQKAGAFDRLAQRHQAATARIAELEKELQQYKASVPGPGDGKGAAGVIDEETIDGAMAKLERDYAREG